MSAPRSYQPIVASRRPGPPYAHKVGAPSPDSSSASTASSALGNSGSSLISLQSPSTSGQRGAYGSRAGGRDDRDRLRRLALRLRQREVRDLTSAGPCTRDRGGEHVRVV